MSSTLFARGTTTQVGLRRRAEEINKNITDIRNAVDVVKDLPVEFRILRTRVEALETRNPVFEQLTKAKTETAEVLTTHTEKLSALNAHLPNLEKLNSIVERLDKMEALTDTLTELNAATASIKKMEETLAAQVARVASMRGDLSELEIAVAKFSATPSTTT